VLTIRNTRLLLGSIVGLVLAAATAWTNVLASGFTLCNSTVPLWVRVLAWIAALPVAVLFAHPRGWRQIGLLSLCLTAGGLIGAFWPIWLPGLSCAGNSDGVGIGAVVTLVYSPFIFLICAAVITVTIRIANRAGRNSGRQTNSVDSAAVDAAGGPP
jgi:hypothetical protein